MKGGIFGEKTSGKSTLLNIFASQFGSEAGGERNKRGIAVVHIPDDRVDFLAEAFGSKKKVYPTITLEEIPAGTESLVDGSNAPALRNCDFLILVVPSFQYGPGGTVGKRTVSEYVSWVEEELCFADYMVAEKRLERLTKEGKRDREFELLKSVTEALENSKPLRTLGFSPEEEKLLSGFSFITELPMIVVVNVDEGGLGDQALEKEMNMLCGRGYEVFSVCAALEEEVMELPSEEREEFLRELNITSSAGQEILRRVFSLLDLIVFLTASANEARAWTVKRGTSAREAAGRIHSDMERGFIRAEVISFEEFREFGDMAKAKSAGKVRLEGKDYVVQEGDILTIRFNI